MTEKQKIWREANKEHLRAYHKAYRQKNKAARYAQWQAWVAKNLDRRREIARESWRRTHTKQLALREKA